MTTGRRPTLTPDELDDTVDEQPRRHTGPVRRVSAADLDAAEVVLEPFIDAPPDHPLAPQRRDLEDRVTALEKRATLHKWGERVLSAIAGSSMAVLVWALTKAEASGDAKATARAVETERIEVRDTVRALVPTVAVHAARLDALAETLRTYYFPGGARPTSAVIPTPAPTPVTP